MCGCKKNKESQTQTQTQSQKNSETVKTAVTKIVEKYYSKK